jgi:tripartite-type tricarboxylate transporter receptor subunit TctC
VTYASSAVGGILHFAGELFAHTAGIKLNHIPHKGANDVVLAVLSGTVQSSWSVVSAAIPLLGPDKLKIVAVASDKRSSLVPDVPTFNELGVKGLKVDTWFGVLGPAGMPPEVTKRINDSIMKLMGRSDFQAKLLKFGAEPRGLGPAEFKEQVRSELEQFAEVAKAANIKVD